MHAVGRDRHRRLIAQPDMAVEAGALIPPALHRIRIDADGDDIRPPPEARKPRHAVAHGVIAGEIVRNDAAIDPDGREGCDATEFQLDPPPTKRGAQPEAAPVPADPARAIALRDIGGLHEGLERGPVMRQVDGLPVAIVEIDRRRTTGVAGLDRQIGRIVRVKRGGLDIALMEQPAAIHQDAYFERPSAGGFERPYGWAWLLALHDEASRHDAGWAQALEPFALFLAERFRTFLPRLTYPLRVGTHFNTSFALTLAWDWAEGRDNGLRSLIAQSVITWFDRDIDCQAWEPGGDEFLSPALTEALVMSRVFDAPSFRNWFDAFLPRVGEGEPATLFTPAIVSDRNDGKIAHLDGLNLSRAWCWRTSAGNGGAL